MAQFEFWYSETQTFKGYFEAESIEEAVKLLEQAQDGEIAFDDLPQWWNKDKGFELEFDPNSVKEI